MSADLYSITLHENTIKPNKSIGNILSCQIYKSQNIIRVVTVASPLRTFYIRRASHIYTTGKMVNEEA